MSAWRNRRPESPYLSLILAIGGLSFVRSPKRRGVASYLIGLLIDEKVRLKLAGEFGTDAAVDVCVVSQIIFTPGGGIFSHWDE